MAAIPRIDGYPEHIRAEVRQMIYDNKSAPAIRMFLLQKGDDEGDPDKYVLDAQSIRNYRNNYKDEIIEEQRDKRNNKLKNRKREQNKNEGIELCKEIIGIGKEAIEDLKSLPPEKRVQWGLRASEILPKLLKEEPEIDDEGVPVGNMDGQLAELIKEISDEMATGKRSP